MGYANQAPHAWNKHLNTTLKQLGFKQSTHELAVYGRGNGGAHQLVGVYIDNLLITGSNQGEIYRYKDKMKAHFLMRCAKAPTTLP